MARSTRFELPITQVHLDFHTSELVSDVGADFDADAFADTFARAHVGMVTVFGKCHHGWSYYPTKVGAVHPSLKFDLMGRQIAALHKRGIRAPVYLSVGLDERSWRLDPGLEAVGPGGRIRDALRPGWHLLCMNAPEYIEYVAAQAEEVLENYPADGLFYDILMHPKPSCQCARCIARMVREGVDPEDPASAAAFSHRVIREAHQRLVRMFRGKPKGLSCFFNSCFTLAARDLVPYDTHVDVESLPTGGWGYGHFPLMGRFGRTFGKPFVGMTARFHKSWGDLGGLKPQAALEQECFHALMLGGLCNIGDHLPPRGRLDPPVYERIGRVFREVKAREPWCHGATPVAPIAVVAAPDPSGRTSIVPMAAAGAVRMLAEAHLLFDVIDAQADFAPYEALVLPDDVRLDPALAARVKAYLARGGKVLATACSGMAPDEDRFALAAWPVSYVGPARHTQPYFIVGKDLSCGIPDMPHALYRPGPEVKAKAGAAVLARLGDPYFSRTWRTFSGHTEAALSRRTNRPAIVQKGRVAYAQAPLFTAYAETAYPVYRQVVANLLDRLLGRRLLEVTAPTTARVTMLRQGRRTVIHLMNYVAERRAEGMDIIEDRQPLHDVRVAVAIGKKPRRVYLAPEETDLKFTFKGGRVEVVVPVIDGHGMIVVE
ncbi:MAG TPA: beta-galactosidase trimerization domain-containing protein [Phycisphaerae bacterium]|nr:beta-galactosidase trimerization domain-containing protein [Phycisphaerae bacterium]